MYRSFRSWKTLKISCSIFFESHSFLICIDITFYNKFLLKFLDIEFWYWQFTLHFFIFNHIFIHFYINLFINLKTLNLLHFFILTILNFMNSTIKVICIIMMLSILLFLKITLFLCNSFRLIFLFLNYFILLNLIQLILLYLLFIAWFWFEFLLFFRYYWNLFNNFIAFLIRIHIYWIQFYFSKILMF